MPSVPGAASTAERGRELVLAELVRRGFEVEEIRTGGLVLLRAGHRANGACRLVRVKTRTSGTWQGSIRDGVADPPSTEPPTVWVFVDLSATRPAFFVVPDAWMRRNIHEEHQAYLDRHHGSRARTDDSEHHAIQLSRLEAWQERWELLCPDPAED